MFKPELLAPAGSWEAMVAAVQNGADAVYLGGKAFSARAFAANFDNEQLKQAVEYCHVRGVKVYVTVNIIVADEELEEALHFLHFLHNIGVDAVILQDLGLAAAARKLLPNLPLHASTQMTVHNTPGVELLKQLGCERIVLSREMSLKDIARIKQTTGAELETFVHGALCVCYSGQCLMSSMIGGRSGNRGKCAQPCRLQYRLVDRKGRPLVDAAKVGEYLLSPRDINLSEHIPDLIQAGIDSFKIEGRMKRPEYVATVVRIYRELLDQALELERKEDFQPSEQQKRELEQIFNRDFSTGYYYGNPGSELMSYKRPNNRGVLIGRVKRYRKDQDLVEITLQEPLRVGDGIEVWVTQGGRVGVEVHRLLVKNRQVDEAPAGSTVSLPIPGKVRPGDRVFKTHDVELMNRAKITYTSSKESRKIPLRFTVRAAVGQPLFMQVEDRDGFVAEAYSEETGQRAENRPLTEEFLRNQLNRLGNTPFALTELYCELQGEVIFPVRVINELRRRVLKRLEEQRQQARLRSPINQREFAANLEGYFNAIAGKFKQRAGKPKLAVNVSEYAALQAAVEAGADIVYFGGESYRSRKPITLSDIEKASDLCRQRKVQFILSTPRILQDDELKGFDGFLRKALPYTEGALIGNLGLLKLFVEKYSKSVISDFSLNVFNRFTVAALNALNVERITLSPELTMVQIKELAAHRTLPLELLVHGPLPLMVTEYCALGSLMGGLTSTNQCAGPCRNQSCGLKDRKGVVFPIEVDQYCHQHIFNSKELCLIDDLGTLADAGISVLRIDARIVSPARVGRITEAYRQVLDLYPLAEWKNKAVSRKAELEKETTGFTKGHYYRGVI